MRFPIVREARYVVSRKGKTITGSANTVNISSTGVWFTTDQPLAPGDRVELGISWPAQLDNKTALKLVVTGRIVRVSENGAAMAIERYEFRLRGSIRANTPSR